MDITTYVESLRRDLTAAAASGGPDVQAAAERMSLALDPAVRMVLLEALSHAAAEISQDLGGGSIDVRLKGREPQFVTTPPPPPAAPAPADVAPDDETDDEDKDGPVARITLRLPEGLKQRAEESAGKRGQSLNTWLVSAVRSAVNRAASNRAVNVDIDLSGIPFGGDIGRGRRGPGQNVSGWVR